MPQQSPYKILMLVHDRPIYTYMALDALCRATYSPYQLTVVHHRLQPGLVDHVLDTHLRRKTIHRIVQMTSDLVDWTAIMRIAMETLTVSDEFLFYIEDDVVIEKSCSCWIARMVELMRDEPKLALLGSAIDKSDFLDPEDLAADLKRPLNADELAKIKAHSPERMQSFKPGQRLFTAHNVPGRLFCLRVSAMTHDLPNTDIRIDKRLKAQGWATAVLTTVRHRHMSLLNYYDYPSYYIQRQRHIDNLRR